MNESLFPQQAVDGVNNPLSPSGRDWALTSGRMMSQNRSSLAGSAASAGREFAPGNRYHFRAGQVHFRLIPRFETEFNSNVYFSPSNPISDIILRPGLRLELDWVITKKNRLFLNVGLEYEKYLRAIDRDNSGFRMRPDTELAYSLYAGDFVITLYDRPSIEQDPSGDPTLTNVAPYTRLMNTAGLSVVWDLNHLILSAVAERQDVQSLNGNFSGLNSVAYVGSLSAIYLFTPTFSAGPFVTVSQTDYLQSTLNNMTSYQMGVMANHMLTTYTTLNYSAGLQVMEFADTGTPSSSFTVDSNGNIDNVTGTAGGGNFIGPFFSVGITNRLNRFFDQSFGLALQPQASSVSNYAQIYSAFYRLDWRMNRLIDANLQLRYSNGQVSGSAPSYQRFEIKTGVKGKLTQRIGWKMELGYIFEAQTMGAGNVTQTRCVVGLDYAF